MICNNHMLGRLVFGLCGCGPEILQAKCADQLLEVYDIPSLKPKPGLWRRVKSDQGSICTWHAP